MTKYTIPERFIPGFNEISSLNSENLQAIISIVESLKVGDGPEYLSTALSENKLLNGLDVYEISITLFSLVNLIFEDGVEDVEGLLEDLIASYKEMDHVPRKRPGQLNALKQNLFALLSNGSTLNLTVKAIRLNVEFDKTYSKSRIFTDIRVVFDSDINGDSQAAILVHNLQLEYKENETSKQLYITLDSDDLKSLKEQIDRAIVKESSLRKIDKISFIEIKP